MKRRKRIGCKGGLKEGVGGIGWDEDSNGGVRGGGELGGSWRRRGAKKVQK